jgi:hypothetical protein
MVSTRATATDGEAEQTGIGATDASVNAHNAKLPGGPVPASEFEEPDFSLESEVHEFAGLLFDMDGTIIDSTAAVVQHWTS